MGKGVFQQDKFLGISGVCHSTFKRWALGSLCVSAQRESTSTCLVSV